MSIHKEHNWDEDWRLTAYALGELEGNDLVELEALLEGDVEGQRLVEELRSLGGTLEEQFAAEVPMQLSEEQRLAIAAESSGQSARGSNLRLVRRVAQWGGLTAASVVAGAFLLSRFGPFDSAPSVLLEARLDRSVANAPAASGLPREAARRKLRFSTPAGRPERELLRDLGYTEGLSADPSSDRRQVLEEQEVLEQVFFEEQDLQREGYDPIIDNPFLSAQGVPLSTFSIDVDTASYSNVRRKLQGGTLPQPDAVRVEEFINYFRYDYGAPAGDQPFSVNVEVGSAPWAPTHRLVRIGLQAMETLPEDRKASNLVFLMDVSGSMNSPDKLPLLKQALHLLVQELDERDTVSIVVYAGASGLALPATRCDESVAVHMALEALSAGGSTNGGAGIELAYKVAAEQFIDGGINRVILATDGDFNVGVSDDGSLVRLIQEKAKTGVFLSVLGFGQGNLQDSKMEKLADKGNGNYAYIDSMLEARKVLVEQMGSTLETVAKDVKIQVEFNPAEVSSYRLIGYENRLLAAQDFNDDTKDAGEIGAGHRVTALYEVVPVGVEPDLAQADALRYRSEPDLTREAFNGELLMLKLRYKQPQSNVSSLISTPVRDNHADFQELSSDTRWAASVAAFGMLLRGSEYRGTTTIADVTRWAKESVGEDRGGYRVQFISLVQTASELMNQ